MNIFNWDQAEPSKMIFFLLAFRAMSRYDLLISMDHSSSSGSITTRLLINSLHLFPYPQTQGIPPGTLKTNGSSPSNTRKS